MQKIPQETTLTENLDNLPLTILSLPYKHPFTKFSTVSIGQFMRNISLTKQTIARETTLTEQNENLSLAI